MRRLTFSLACVIALVSAFSGFAQESSRTFKSDSGDCYAVLVRKPDNSYVIEVYKKETGFLLWSSWIEWNERKEILISDDGRFVVLVTPYYEDDQNVIEIYRKALPLLFVGKVLKIKTKDLVRADSGKYLWIQMAIDPVKFNYSDLGVAESVEFYLIDRRTVIIPLE